MFCKALKFLLLLSFLTANSVTVCLAQFRFNHLTTPQGSFEYSVTALYQDHRGFIWIGTTQGLYRYDGHNLQEYHHNRFDSTSIADNHIHAIVEDKYGLLWLGTNEGISRMDPYTYECTNFCHNAKDTTSLNCDFDNFVFTDNEHHIWAGNSRGLSIWDEHKNHFRFLYGDGNTTYNVNGLVEENSDSYWFTSREGVVNYRVSAHTFSVYPLKDKATKIAGLSLLIDHKGSLWVGAWGCGLFRFNKQTHQFTEYTWNDLSHDDKTLVNIPLCIMENTDARGTHNLWVGTSEGLLIINNDTFPGSLLHHDIIKHDIVDSHSISAGNVMRFLKDREGNIWIGTDHGVSSLITSRQHFKSVNDHPSGNVNTIKKIDSLIYVTCWYGDPLTIYDKNFHVLKKWNRIPPASTNPQANRVSDIIKDHNGNFWIATNFGLVKYDAQHDNFKTLNHVKGDTGIQSKYLITSLCDDDSGRIWIGTYDHGIDVYYPATNRSVHFLAGKVLTHTLCDNLIWVFHKDVQGNIWIGTNHGLGEFDWNAQQFIQMPDSPHSIYNLHNVTVNDFAVDSDKTFWLATNKGLMHFDPVTKKQQVYSTEDGLQDESLNSVIIDKNGNIWMSDLGGLSRFNPQKNFFTNYNSHSGMIEGGANSNFYMNNEGKLWIGGSNVLLSFDPKDLNRKQSPLSVYLTSIIVSGKEIKNDSIVSGLKPLVTTHDLNDFTFTFTAPEYNDPTGVKYQYKLDGVNPTWIDAKNNPVANYANLPPDNYVFHARAINASGIVSNNDVVFAFVIQPPFWRTWWFIIIVLVLLITALIVIVRYVFTRQLRERVLVLQKEQAIQKERNRISRDMHDDLGSGLTKIAIMSEVAKQKLKKDEDKHQLDSISDSARSLVDNLNEIIWALNPRNDNLDSLMAYIRSYSTKYLETFDINCSFMYPDSIPKIDLSEEKRRNIFLVVKESLHNIVKHSAAKEVKISLETTGDTFTITIQDNGKGFDVSDNYSGNGLRNMFQRMQSIGGAYSITSQGQGTITAISIKMPVLTL
jgi:ligand-binding sensor domain-containing protein/signal transduction histidine kinase